MAFSQFDPTAIDEEFVQLRGAINVKKEQDEDPVPYSSAIKRNVTQVTPTVSIDN